VAPRQTSKATGAASTRATLAQIARAAGVSIPTVSKVLNGRDDVGETTRERVEAVLRDHQYIRRNRPRIVKPPRFVDLVMDGLDGSWPASVTSGVESAAYEADLHVAVSVARAAGSNRLHLDQDWLERTLDRGSAGVVLGLVELTEQQRIRLERARLPCVMIHPLSNPPPGVASVGANTWAGAYDATEHLITLGHRRIALVTGPRGQLSEQARIAGYRSAMAAAGLDVAPELVRHGSYDRSSGKQQVEHLLGLSPQPTAIFICSDHMAIGGYEALADARLKVPRDMSVVGFDDLPEARWVYPALTTVRQPLKEMAKAALQLLVRLINQDEVDSTRLEFATSLIVRHSTRAV
jgi:LacI family transcriptional regulator